MMSYFDKRFADQTDIMTANHAALLTVSRPAVCAKTEERLASFDSHISRIELSSSAANDRAKRKDRERDILIRGVPLTGTEDWRQLNKIDTKLAAVIGSVLRPSDILRVFRIKKAYSAQRDPMLLVRIAGCPKELTAECLGFKSPSCDIHRNILWKPVRIQITHLKYSEATSIVRRLECRIRHSI